MENTTLLGIKAAVAAGVAALTAVWGWFGWLVVVWVGLMLSDWLIGSAAAAKDGRWSSAKMRDGAWHKGGMILVVAVSAIADGIIVVIGDQLPIGFSWPGLLLPLVLAWYIITEFGSILENAVEMGTKVPSWLIKMLKISLKAVNDAGEAAVEQTEEET